MMRQSTDRRTARPVRPAAAAVSKMISRAWSLPPQRTFVAVERNIRVPMSDGTVLLADHYLPITSRPAATVLVRCPYGRGGPFGLLNAQLIAERGFHVLLQSVRGTFGSGGQFEPMRGEISDGQDTVTWLRGQSWFDGRLATFGASYLGFVQWALAMDPPPELAAAVVFVGPHDFSRTAYRNGALDLYNFLSWSDLIVHQEQVNPVRGMIRTVTADRRLRPALDRAPVSAGARDLFGTDAPWFETWLEHPQLTDPFWTPLQCSAALERLSVPTLLVGGWQDLFLEQRLPTGDFHQGTVLALNALDNGVQRPRRTLRKSVRRVTPGAALPAHRQAHKDTRQSGKGRLALDAAVDFVDQQLAGWFCLERQKSLGQ